MPFDSGRDPGTLPKFRQISDVRTMRALSHPVRIELLEVLGLHGPMTATEAGERIGESPTTCSFHLRQLEKYGFVEEAGGGKGRARPWKLASIGMTIPATEDTETEIAAAALNRLVRERQLARYRAWLETRALYPKRWRTAVGDSEYVFWVTPEEFQELGREIHELLVSRFFERHTEPAGRPEGALPVELLLFSYPMASPAEAGP